MYAMLMQASYEPPPFPTFSKSTDAPGGWKGDLLALGLWEDDVTGGGEGEKSEKSEASVTQLSCEAAKKLDGELGGIIAELLEAGDFKGKKARAVACTTRLPGHAKMQGGSACARVEETACGLARSGQAAWI